MLNVLSQICETARKHIFVLKILFLAVLPIERLTDSTTGGASMTLYRSLARLMSTLLLLVVACAPAATTTAPSVKTGCSTTTLRLVAGTHIESLRPSIEAFNNLEENKTNHVCIEVKTAGLVDQVMLLQQHPEQLDAIWPGDSLVTILGDSNHVVKNARSIGRSPVALGVDYPIAQSLGWIGKQISTREILDAINNGKLRYTMPSASQSEAGTIAYFGFSNALKSSQGPLTTSDLQDPKFKENLRNLFSVVQRSSSSSSGLMENYVNDPNLSGAMFNFEALLIQANKKLIANNRQPLYIVYPTDSTLIADSQLAYVDNSDQAKRSLFLKFQNYLLTDESTRNLLRENGWRLGVNGVGSTFTAEEMAKFDPKWGINPMPSATGFNYPPTNVMRAAIDLYQVGLRRGSVRCYAIDVSPSMGSSSGIKDANGKEMTRVDAMKQAMNLLLNPTEASRISLQATQDDINIVIPFGDGILPSWKESDWTVTGSDTSPLNNLVQKVGFGNGTNIYTPTLTCIKIVTRLTANGNRSGSVITMTDGESTEGGYKTEFVNYVSNPNNQKVPVHTLQFGGQGQGQLTEMSNRTGGLYFNGSNNLEATYRQIAAQNN